jgi:lipid-A-disaccharide synthase
MKYFIIAGEASGDLHGSNLIKALKKQDSAAEIVCWGGDLMESAGGRLLQHYREISFMGFLEVLLNLKTILRAMTDCKRQIEMEKPDKLILIDYPGFNFRIAKWAKKQGFEVNFYISPQLWAWKEGRIKKVKRDIDKMFVILPFEKDFYKKHNYKVEFVGHPLLDVTENYVETQDFKQQNQLDDRPIIALLPGSRKQEIQNILAIMLTMVAKFPDYQFVIAAAPAQSLDFYQNIIQTTQNQTIKVIQNQTYDILNHAFAALVTSGTATLEAALFNVPQVVCYKGSSISFAIAKRLVRIKYISLVNLIMDKPLVKELIQNELTVNNLEIELNKILAKKNREILLSEYKLLKQKLGGEGASERMAKLIV